MRGIQARTFTPCSSSVSELDAQLQKGYIGWHHDRDGPGLGVSVNPSAIVKCFTYFEDVGVDDGAYINDDSSVENDYSSLEKDDSSVEK